MDALLHRDQYYGNPYKYKNVHPGTPPPIMEPNKGRQLPALDISSVGTYLREVAPGYSITATAMLALQQQVLVPKEQTTSRLTGAG
ncbi:hypothetical protein AVEN_44985-1 [Araneus ventricosus]|uniref:Uncharacterized protein n=1 Tax=Araneus ventricosus TaxID=182803 RepID=A0A4Y2U2J5_ARAVE|nr:hypothetical protein AVEN_44985-1 [Araneus ventricosus]